MLRAEKLSKVYRTGSGEVPALRGVDVAFAPGHMTAIVGPSGSGKSTLLNLLAGFDVPTTGDVTLDGVSLGSLDERRRSEVRLHRFGFVFQSFNLVTVLSAEQNVAFPLGLAGKGAVERRERSRELLARFGLERRADHLPHRLSGGERQRVALARALANDPDVIFADEPTGNLDSRSGVAVLEALQQVASDGHTVIVVTHDQQVAGIADGRIELRDGLVIGASGAVEAVVSRADDALVGDAA
ncbi:MAG: ABC transporter ATP-binding protein [Trueperaceae bacterium]